jgi:hypothetical protein
MDSLLWIKSSYSGGSGDNCVEVAALPEGGFAVRDSKNAKGPALRFTSEEWHSFIRNLHTLPSS